MFYADKTSTKAIAREISDYILVYMWLRFEEKMLIWLPSQQAWFYEVNLLSQISIIDDELDVCVKFYRCACMRRVCV